MSDDKKKGAEILGSYVAKLVVFVLLASVYTLVITGLMYLNLVGNPLMPASWASAGFWDCFPMSSFIVLSAYSVQGFLRNSKD